MGDRRWQKIRVGKGEGWGCKKLNGDWEVRLGLRR